MNRNRTIGYVILVLALAGIVWAVVYHNHKKNNTNTNPNLSISVYNTTQAVDGVSVRAHPNDQLSYTLTAQNPSDKVISGFVIEVGIGKVTQAATLTDAQGANYDSSNNSLMWTPLDIPANGSIQKQFTVRVKSTVPTNVDDRTMKVTYNNEVDSTVAASTATGTVGQNGSTYTAPKTGIPGWISFFLAAFITFGYMLFRIAHKLGKPTN